MKIFEPKLYTFGNKKINILEEKEVQRRRYSFAARSAYD